MGTAISINAAQADIEQDARLTLTNAIARDGKYKERAESFLGPALGQLNALAERRRVATTAYSPLRAQLAVAAEKCDVLVLKTKDALYNDLGRPGHDPTFALWFPEGAATYTNNVPSNKGAALETLAGILETTPHPSVPGERTAALVAELRAAAIGIDGLNALAKPIRTQLEVLRAQHRTQVKTVHLQLARLKKAWKSEGLTEVEIHAMIPDRPVATPAARAAEGAATVPVTTAPPVLTVVPPADEWTEDEATDEVPAEEAVGK